MTDRMARPRFPPFVQIFCVLCSPQHSWLLSDPNMKLRSMYPRYIHAVEKYFKKLLPELVPLQVIFAYFALNAPKNIYLTMHVV